ncbi:hypothetical protein DYB34_013879, partial [Aphanomyces astaci]
VCNVVDGADDSTHDSGSLLEFVPKVFTLHLLVTLVLHALLKSTIIGGLEQCLRH